MGNAEKAVTAVELLVLLAAVALVLGPVLGQPVLLSYVETGSMEPTLSPNDGFVAIPSAVSGPTETGDVIVFRAERLQGGGLTTHRVVGKTDAGYITKGDANPTTDQAANEPPVQEAQIVATALQVGGRVVVIPHVGTVVGTIQDVVRAVIQRVASILGIGSLGSVQGIALLVLLASLVGYLWDVSKTSGRPTERDDRRNVGVGTLSIVVVVAVAILLAATASMVVPGGPTKVDYVSSSHDIPGSNVVGAGTTETVTYRVSNAGLVPMVVILEPHGETIDVQPRRFVVDSRSVSAVTVTISAPPETGYYRGFVVQHRYLGILPQSVIGSLFDLHPWLPIVVIDGLLGGTVLVFGGVLVGPGRIRYDKYSRERPLGTSLRRLLRRLYR